MNATHPPRRRLWLTLGLLGLAAIAVLFAWPRIQLWLTLSAARTAIAERDYDTALVHLERARDQSPNEAEPYFLLARVYRHQGKPDPLRKSLERARDLGFSNRRIRLEEYLALAQNGQMTEALPQLAPLLIESSADEGQEICEAYVSGFFATYKFAEAFDLMEVWQKDYPKDPQPYFSRGLYEAHAGNHQKAIAELSKGVELAPRRDDIRRTLAKSLLATQQFDEAETRLRDLLRRQPRHVESLTLLGSCLLEQGQLDEARTTLAKALEIDSTDRQSRLLTGRVELKAGHPELAIEWLEPVVKELPYEFDARFQFGTALQQAGRGDEAVEHLQFVAAAQTALARVRNLMIDARNDPDNAAARLEIGLTLLKYESPEAGANWLRNVLELDPDNAKAHAGLAEYYDQRGDHDRAALHREKAE